MQQQPVYIIVKARLLDAIESKINEKIAEGYVLQGQLIVAVGGETDYMQPMVLKSQAQSILY
jgi:hypothetical protein